MNEQKHEFIEDKLFIISQATLIAIKQYVENHNQDKPKRKNQLLWQDVLSLYLTYYDCAKYQKTNTVWATTSFVARGLNWSQKRVVKCKKVLIELNLIEEIKLYNHEKKRYGKNYIKIKYLWGREKESQVVDVEKPCFSKDTQPTSFADVGKPCFSKNTQPTSNLTGLGSNGVNALSDRNEMLRDSSEEKVSSEESASLRKFSSKKSKVQEVFDHWNSYKGSRSSTKRDRKKNLVSWRSHNKLTPDIELAITRALETHSAEDICSAIDNYHTVLFDEHTYWCFVWSLYYFLSRREGTGKKKTDCYKWWKFLPGNFDKYSYESWDNPELVRDSQPDNTKLVTGWWIYNILGKDPENYSLPTKITNDLIELARKISTIIGTRNEQKFEQEFNRFHKFVNYYRRGFRSDPTTPKNPITLSKMLSGEFLTKYEQWRKDFWRV